MSQERRKWGDRKDGIWLKDLPAMNRIMPGVMPKVIRKVRKLTAIPVLAGGLIADKEDVMGALDAGAVAVSTTDPAIWRL